MKTFYAQMSDGSSIMRQADRMEISGESLRVWLDGELVAYIDLGTVLYAQIYEKKEGKRDGNWKAAD